MPRKQSEELIISRRGKPVGKPRPVDRRSFVPRDTVIKAFAGAARIDFERFRADIDRYVDPTPRLWPEP